MKTPLESIKESVSISNRFFAIGTVAAIVVECLWHILLLAT